ncbi:hypothetical protein BX600DRAFT_505773 [Xylariales sp. PMI_506]|nr:hypothetical protein BX600DRAFT_505773 [Xylariales sp. PMI_506]
MPSLFSRIRGKDGQGRKSKKGGLADLANQAPAKPRWDDAYTRTSVEPDEVDDLIRRCTQELKSRALNHPFLLLPFRPTSDPSSVRIFIRRFFDDNQNMRGEALAQELRMSEPMVICGVLKWCWSRIQGGVVGWDAYELFKVGEQDSNMARNAFTTFIPMSVDTDARAGIITDYFDLLSAIAAHGKANGFGGRKLSRMASWWAFEHKDTGNGFEGGYQFWLKAADATSHLFFAYLRSLAPQPSVGGISMLPLSLQKLLQETEYPPQKPSLLQSSTNRVVMVVDTVSPTPFALLRRASHFQYRDDDRALHEFSEYEDPVRALTEECRRVLRAISLANQSQVSSSKHSTSLRDASWSRFEDIGFGGALEEEDEEEDLAKATQQRGLRTTPASGGNLGRPTTPSWADFLSSGFVDENGGSPTNHLLPPDKVLPPIDATVRQRSSQSHRPRLEGSQQLEPGELANITRFDLDDSFWWVWMSSLAPEETAARKSAFGRCAVIETVIRSGRWLVMEEMVKGAAPQPAAGAYVAEKKGFFSWTRRNKGVSRSKSTGKDALARGDHLKASASAGGDVNRANIAPDQHARIHAAAQQLQAKQALSQQTPLPERRGRTDAELMQERTTSVLTLQPVILKEAAHAMKWANKYDKDTIREAYLANTNAGRGLAQATIQPNGYTQANGSATEFHAEPETPQHPPAIAEEEPTQVLEPPQDAVVDRTPTGRNSPLPPPPQERNSMEAIRQAMMSPEPSSPDDKKKKKLHKEEKKSGGGGFRKLFGRKNRSSKLPENAPGDLKTMLSRQVTRDTVQEEPTPSVPAESVRTLSMAPSTTVTATEDESGEITPTQTTVVPSAAQHEFDPEAVEPTVTSEPTLEPPHEELSRIPSADADEAREEFSRFDQGPLTDQPAFVPEDDDSEDDATPPPIARHTPTSPVSTVGSAPSPPVPYQDRWAQIRKNAAERARQTDTQGREAPSKPTDAGEDANGEETIESRVARIKARVAELTGNMEGTAGPGSRTPPSRR